MEAIQTFYKGYHFRSRLEARWAKFFDALRIKWVYEPEGFKHQDTWYLPDFWVKYPDEDQYPYPIGKPPERGVYVEIKGQQPTKAELDKCVLLAKYSHHWSVSVNLLIKVGRETPDSLPCQGPLREVPQEGPGKIFGICALRVRVVNCVGFDIGISSCKMIERTDALWRKTT